MSVTHSSMDRSKRTLPRSAKLLLAINAFNALGTSLSAIFINVYWYKLTHDMSQTMLFNLITYLVWVPAFVLAGWLSKRSSRTKALWIGSFVQLLFYILVLALGQQSSHWLILLGCINGIGQGFYWMSVNVMTVDVTQPSNRDWYNGISGIVGALTGMIGPLSAGFIVDQMPENTGYTFVFLISFVCYLVSLCTALFLPKDRASGKWEWRPLLQVVKQPEWRNLSYSFIGIAFRDGALSIAIWLWVYVATGSESSTGNYAFFTTLMSIISFYIVGRFGQDKTRWSFIVFGSVMLSFSMLGITFLTTWSLVAYGLISAACRPFFDNTFNTLTYNTVSRYDQQGKLRVEMVIWRELMLSIGRISSVGLLYWIYRTQTEHLGISLNVFLFVMIAMGLVPLLFVKSALRPRKEEELLESKSA